MEAEELILKNIRIFRKVKDIKSENLARSLGISQSEYSKLENGQKRKWTEYLPKIAEVLQVTFQELVTVNLVIQKPSPIPASLVNEPSQYYQAPDVELYERIIYELKEKERLKDELLISLRDSQENYKQKYENVIAKLSVTERSFNNI